MGNKVQLENLVLDAMRLAERAHRTRKEGPITAKRPMAKIGLHISFIWPKWLGCCKMLA